MRKTKQKLLIKEEINRFNKLFTAEELLSRVKKTNKKISIATIYRFLKDLREKKELHSYLCDRKTIYSKEENNHCHFICQQCGETKHFEVSNLDFLKNKLKGNICHFQVDVYGVCDKCFKKEFF
ncbi:MAG: transcriptional repressor [Nanoarchaeota archaeon]